MGDVNNYWFKARIALLALCFIASPLFLSATRHEDFSQPSWSFPLIMVGIVTLATIFVVGLQQINPLSHETWERPSWSSSPFDGWSLLRNFHISAWCLISTGVGSLVFGLVATPHSWAGELPLSVGVGVLLGVRIVSSGSEGVQSGDA
jgi:hypothetical protein